MITENGELCGNEKVKIVKIIDRDGTQKPMHRVVSSPIEVEPMRIRGGFEAYSFKYKDFGGLMDPLVMVDHYRMTEPTFGPHPHAGMSAVSVLFEDSVGVFNNRDSLGNNIDLSPGDLYWLKAGSGAVHDEMPMKDAKTHGLQIFVNLPARLKHSTPRSLHVKAPEIPCVVGDGVRVRVVLGESNGLAGANSPTLPLTILDGALAAGKRFVQELPAGHAAWVYTIRGEMELHDGETIQQLGEGRAISLRNGERSEAIVLCAATDSQFALLAGEPIKEEFVQRGPFVMSTASEIDQLEADYQAGRLGSIE